jgi:hypothetical protein
MEHSRGGLKKGSSTHLRNVVIPLDLKINHFERRPMGEV